MTWLLVIVAVLWILFRLGMKNTFIILFSIILSLALWFLGFLTGGFVTAMFQPDAITALGHADLSPLFLKNPVLLESMPILLLMLSTPFIFVVDLLWWSFEISIFHGTISLWLFEAVALYHIGHWWLSRLADYMEAKREIV